MTSIRLQCCPCLLHRGCSWRESEHMHYLLDFSIMPYMLDADHRGCRSHAQRLKRDPSCRVYWCIQPCNASYSFTKRNIAESYFSSEILKVGYAQLQWKNQNSTSYSTIGAPHSPADPNTASIFTTRSRSRRLGMSFRILQQTTWSTQIEVVILEKTNHCH